MIFLRYESFNEYIRKYPVTSLFLLANIVMLIVTVFSGGLGNHFTLIRLGALYDFTIDNGREDWWRYVASMFLHFDVPHFLFNNFALFVFAPPVERILGHFKYFLFYMGSGIIGNLISEGLQVVSNDSDAYVSAGASGAIYGIYGAFLFLILFHRNLLDEASRKTVQTILIIGVVYSVASPFVGGPTVNISAHFGGLLGGFLIFGAFFQKTKLK
ncbi:rhomboid family intramembrane serine protease [Marinicrinis lubricantis]|uniref:Rhomboid family intramembrane serine protease n=1 Tax=Marinicrinis lubricantis TaxID=2086470 RepID=A0ABW1ITC8_9BACL